MVEYIISHNLNTSHLDVELESEQFIMSDYQIIDNNTVRLMLKTIHPDTFKVIISNSKYRYIVQINSNNNSVPNIPYVGTVQLTSEDKDIISEFDLKL